MIKHVFFAVTIGLVAFSLYLAQYTGAFKSVYVGLDERGPYILVYQNHVGAYHKIVEKIQNVEAWAKENKLDCKFTFGEFFDDPSTTEEGRLKSRAGCLIEEKNTAALATLKTLTLPADFAQALLPKTKVVVALFTGSPGIGPLKVYPKAESFMNESKLKRKGPPVEIYEVLDPQTMNTTYLFPVE
jgi:AraC family transcriptional regulator